MQHETRVVQVRQIMQGLASLPGGGNVDVISRKFPRVGPAEPGTPYQVSTQSFPVQEIPAAPTLSQDTDEVIIRLSGTLDEPQKRDSLVDQLHALFGKPELRSKWDVRTSFRTNGYPQLTYELTIISSAQTAWAGPLA